MRPPRPPLQPPAVALEPRAAVKLQPDVDIDLGQQRNLDSATQAAERECRHGRSQLGMRADVTAALVEADRDVEPSVAQSLVSIAPVRWAKWQLVPEHHFPTEVLEIRV